MVPRKRDAQLRFSYDCTADTPPLSSLPALPPEEEVSICDAVARMVPNVDRKQLLESLRKDAQSRRVRVQQLRRRIASGNYHIPAAEVATALLWEEELLRQ